MTLLRLEGLQLAYGTHVLLDGADLVLEKGERLALVGRNGTGKSTLLKLVAGEILPDDGSIWRAPGLKIGVLEQDLPSASGETIFDVVAQGLPQAGELLAEYHHLVQAAEPDMKRMATLQSRLEAIDGWSFHQRIDVVLTRLGLPADDLMSSLSGGWRRRVALARALVAEPDLLLLDEPTNHLDLDTIAWLEEQLLDFNGAVLFITHDRAFLSKLATTILELDRGRLGRYPGDYAKYQQQKAHELEVEARENAEFDKKLAQEEAWIRQGIKARRTRNEGRVRALEQLRRERSQRREVQGRASFGIDSGERSGKRVVELVGVTHRFGDETIVRDLSLEIQRGDRIGLIGRNGAGKTTLMRSLMGALAPRAGSARFEGVEILELAGNRRAHLGIGYMPEDRRLIPNLTAEENILLPVWAIGVTDYRRRLEWIYELIHEAAAFRDRPAAALSGGQQKMVALARALLVGTKLLLLDEPMEGIAPVLVGRIADILAELKREGEAVLVTESNDSHIADLLDGSYVIERGTVVRRD